MSNRKTSQRCGVFLLPKTCNSIHNHRLVQKPWCDFLKGSERDTCLIFGPSPKRVQKQGSEYFFCFFYFRQERRLDGYAENEQEAVAGRSG